MNFSPQLVSNWKKIRASETPRILKVFQDKLVNDTYFIMSYVNNLKTFVRGFELGSMSVAARDQRLSADVVALCLRLSAQAATRP